MNLARGIKLGPYEILAPIGAGGMGEVWKARDTRLGRIVAIKTVKEQHSERFKQEARSVAALNHPNICQIHDIGPDYIVLEFVEGKTLSGPLPEKEAVRLAIQIATALEAAHKRGIIHRDLKPGNIMVTEEGSVKLLDFGLAKLYQQNASASASPTADYRATQAGAVFGTVAYMSPEQAQGQPADARSDIFSFGLVLYEMLSGKRAFPGESPVATALALVKDEPPPLQASRSLEKILRRCLAKQPSARYQTMLEVKTALEQVFGEMASESSGEPRLSIAVLPFVDMSPAKDNEWFSDGLAEEIINALTQIPHLRVIARTSAFAFKGKQDDIRRIAEALSVTSILEGSVRKVGNRIRITAQLINAADGSHLWSERYDREMTDVFAIQDEISQAIAEKLRGRLSLDRPLIKRYTENVEAYNLYLKGRYHFSKLTPEGVVKAKDYYEQALVIDPSYALAWFGLANLYDYSGNMGLMPPKTADELCRQAALKALELDPMLPQVHSILGLRHALEYDWISAEKEFHRAIELGPDLMESWYLYVFLYLQPMGRVGEGISFWQKAAELDPLSPTPPDMLLYIYIMLRQYDRAIDQSNKALELRPDTWMPHQGLSMIFLHLGKSEDAVRSMETAANLSGRLPIVLGYLGSVYAHTGRVADAHKILDELQELSPKMCVQQTPLAMIHLTLGDMEKGFEYLEKAVSEHEASFIMYLNAFPFDLLVSHPRYHALLRKMNLADLPEVPTL